VEGGGNSLVYRRGGVEAPNGWVATCGEDEGVSTL
jgi:hypothetical protein